MKLPYRPYTRKYNYLCVTFRMWMRLKRQMEQNESHIISRVLAGRTEEFAYFLDTYGQAVFTLIVRMVSSEEDAEELAQDTFMKAYEHLGSFYGESSFSTWIYRIAYNTALSFLRKWKGREIVIDETFWNTVSETEVDEALDDDSEERIELLRQALAQLSAEERALVTLFYEKGKTVQELAEISGLSVSNVKVKLHRVRKKLYILMQKED